MNVLSSDINSSEFLEKDLFTHSKLIKRNRYLEKISVQLSKCTEIYCNKRSTL